jgi:hypothetical protein
VEKPCALLAQPAAALLARGMWTKAILVSRVAVAATRNTKHPAAHLLPTLAVLIAPSGALRVLLVLRAVVQAARDGSIWTETATIAILVVSISSYPQHAPAMLILPARPAGLAAPVCI